jgi:hypothetical protein
MYVDTLQKAAEEYNALCNNYLPHVRKYAVQALVALDQKFDQCVKHGSLAQKRDMDERYCHLLQTIFYCIRMTLHVPVPVETDPTIFDLASKYVLHVDEG